MTLSEFKAWFEGFTEGMEGAPTADQFAKIKAKVKKIDGAPITERIFVDRWWPTYPHYRQWWADPIMAGSPQPLKAWYSAGNATSQANASSEGTVFAGYAYKAIDPATKSDIQTIVFDSHAAMRDLGRAEAQAA